MAELFDPRLPERFWAKLVPEPNTGCWLWVGLTDLNGYGIIGRGRRGEGMAKAHRMAYEALVGAVPEGLELDHLCCVRCCANPNHVEPVTHRENMIRGDTFAARHVSRTACPQGHPYSETNTMCRRGRRYCRECERARNREYHARHREEQNAKRAARYRAAKLVGLLILLAASPAQAGPIIKQSSLLLNCPLGAGAGTGDDNFTCSGGEVLTFARSTVSYACPRTDSENTAVWEEGANTACFIDTCGVVLARSFVNQIVRSEAFDNAAWVDVGTPVRAAGAADSPLNGVDADTLADSIEDDSIAAQEGIGQQYLAANATSLQSVSVWARVTSGTLPFSMCVISGTDTCNTGNGCCSNQTATTAWQRFSASATTGTTSQTKNFRIVIGADGTVATTGTLILWGAHAEATAGLPPYCRSTGAAATTCDTETLTATVDNVLAWQGALEVTVEAFWHALDASAADGANGSSTQGRFFAFYTGSLTNERSFWLQNDGNYNALNANNAGAISFYGAAATPGFGVGTAVTVWNAWGHAQRSYGDGQTVRRRVANETNAPGAVPTTFRIGGRSDVTTGAPGACFRDLRVYRNPLAFMR